MRYILVVSTVVLLGMAGFAGEDKSGPKAGDTCTEDLGGGVKMEFVWCPPGDFLMGSTSSEEGRVDGESQHKVTLTRGFWMGKYEVTQGQWQAVMGSNPSHFKGSADLPVEMVNWNDCQEFVKKLSQRTRNAYRLPTEAEWEYACRAGSTTAYCFGNDASGLGAYAWYEDNSGARTHGKGGKKANSWGLHDMHGNVNEWCQDWGGRYPTDAVKDPQGPSSGEYGDYRVQRGGSWATDSTSCRAASRKGDTPDARIGGLVQTA